MARDRQGHACGVPGQGVNALSTVGPGPATNLSAPYPMKRDLTAMPEKITVAKLAQAARDAGFKYVSTARASLCAYGVIMNVTLRPLDDGLVRVVVYSKRRDASNRSAVLVPEAALPVSDVRARLARLRDIDCGDVADDDAEASLIASRAETANAGA